MMLLAMVSFNMKAQQTTTAYGFAVKGQKLMEPQSYVFKPTGSASDLTLSVKNIRTTLIIKGTNRNDVKVEAKDLLAPSEKAKGLRSVSAIGEDNTGLNLRIEQEGNRVDLSGTSLKRTSQATFTIEVPRAINLTINYDMWGAKGLRVMEVDGDIEVKSSTADVLLADVSGPLSVSSTGGSIEVMFKSLDGSAPTILSSSSGDIDVALSADSKVSFQLRGTQGEIFTDLPTTFKNIEKGPYLQLNEGKEDAVTIQGQGVYGSSKRLVFSGLPTKMMVGDLNSGGSKLEIHTISGDVYLRKR